MSMLIVSVKQGQLRGALEISKMGRAFIAFRGIPYAAPPLGKLRFKDPQPPISWEGVRDALENREPGWQPVGPRRVPEVMGTEDCLYLNVYTTSLIGNKAVFVCIHGGGNHRGDGNFKHGPDYLLERDIVIVTINYRLGALGYFNLNHKVASGNQGLKDQVAALRWVHENIAAFGGDKDNVTVSGNSSGAICTHLLSLSPLTKGLLKRVVLQSHTACSKWPSNEEFCYRLVRKFIDDTDDPEEIVARLQQLPAIDIAKMQFTVMTLEELSLMLTVYGPCIDTASEQPFLPAPVFDLLSNSKEIPTMLEYTTHEILEWYYNHGEEFVKKFNRTFDALIKSHVKIRDETKFYEIKKELLTLYFDGRSEATINDLEAIVDYLSDLVFAANVKRVVQLRRQLEAAPTYLFRFSYCGNQVTDASAAIKSPVMKGAAHGDEMPYIFYLNHYNEGPPPEVGSKDRVTIERMTRLLANFIKFGDPTRELDEFVSVKWEPVTKDAINLLDIGDELVPDVLSETTEKYKTWMRIHRLAEA